MGLLQLSNHVVQNLHNIIWPVRLCARFHCKLLRKSPCEGRSWWREQSLKKLRSLTALIRGFFQQFCDETARKMRTKTTLLIYKSRLFGQNERSKWTFRIWLPGKKNGKARWSCNKMLIDWVRSSQTGKHLARSHGAPSIRHDFGPNIFPSGPPTQSLST